MERRVEPEWLDELPADDPRALGSRRDLIRINQVMRNAAILASALRCAPTHGGSRCLVELGAGDGEFLLRVANRLGQSWRGTQATLVDFRDSVTIHSKRRFSDLGWSIRVAAEDIFAWFENIEAQDCRFIVANLFVHHFAAPKLQRLLESAARSCIFFAAVEPRRSQFSLIFSKLVCFIGGNAVTRHDAPASVRAGFSGNELSRLWPASDEWVLTENRAGPFSHLFTARKQVDRTN